MAERMDPRTLAKWLILAAILYLLLPYDLLPDFLGVPGRVDDLLIMAWLAWLYRSHRAQTVAKGAEQEPAGRSGGAGSQARSEQPVPFDPYTVLGVTPSDSPDAIRAAYRARMKEYHPDKVAHLGEELQVLANEKSREIQRAYRQLKR